MNAILIRLRAELRTQWRHGFGLALVTAVTGGMVIALAAGARRTGSAYPRLMAHERPTDVVLMADGIGPSKLSLDGTELARLPEVAELGRIRSFSGFDGRTDSGVPIGEPDWLGLVAPLDAGADAFFARTKLLAGRRTLPIRADEVVVSATAAERYALEVGDAFTLRFLRPEEYDAYYRQGRALNSRDAVRVTLHVVGIEAPTGEFPPRKPGAGAGRVLLSRAFAIEHGDTLSTTDNFQVWLHGGRAQLPAFTAKVERLAGGVPFDDFGDGAEAIETYAGGADTNRALGQLAVGLWLLAVFSAGGTLVVVGQALHRQDVLAAADHATLRALGMTSGQLVAASVARCALIALMGAVGAVTTAIGFSPLFPVGLARVAEPRPGTAVDIVALGVGAATLVVTVITVGGITAWRASHRVSRLMVGGDRSAPYQSSAVAEALGRASFPLPAMTGTHLALQPGRGAAAVAIRSTIVGATLGVALVATALTLTASVERLLHTPWLYGWNWDVTIGDGFAEADRYSQVVPVLRADPAVAAFSAAADWILDVDGASVTASAFEKTQGHVVPTVVEGRSPSSPDEIMLTGRALHTVHAKIGDVVQVRDDIEYDGPEPNDVPSHPFRIVGRGVLPSLGGSERGLRAAVTMEGLLRVAPPPVPRTYFPVTFGEGVTKETAVKRLRERIALHVVTPDGDRRPAGLINLDGGGNMALVVAAMVGLVAAAMVAHLLATSIRSRRRDLAILKTLGFVRRQVFLTVTWQATTLAGLAVVVGLPVGAAAGRLTWSRLAEHLGVVPQPVVALPFIALAAPAVILIANLVAVVPAWMASRVQPVPALRAE